MVILGHGVGRSVGLSVGVHLGVRTGAVGLLVSDRRLGEDLVVPGVPVHREVGVPGGDRGKFAGVDVVQRPVLHHVALDDRGHGGHRGHRQRRGGVRDVVGIVAGAVAGVVDDHLLRLRLHQLEVGVRVGVVEALRGQRASSGPLDTGSALVHHPGLGQCLRRPADRRMTADEQCGDDEEPHHTDEDDGTEGAGHGGRIPLTGITDSASAPDTGPASDRVPPRVRVLRHSRHQARRRK